MSKDYRYTVDGEKLTLTEIIARCPAVGYIQQTGGWSHHTWWPYAAFDIVAHCGAASP